MRERERGESYSRDDARECDWTNLKTQVQRRIFASASMKIREFQDG